MSETPIRDPDPGKYQLDDGGKVYRHPDAEPPQDVEKFGDRSNVPPEKMWGWALVKEFEKLCSISVGKSQPEEANMETFTIKKDTPRMMKLLDEMRERAGVEWPNCPKCESDRLDDTVDGILCFECGHLLHKSNIDGDIKWAKKNTLSENHFTSPKSGGSDE